MMAAVTAVLYRGPATSARSSLCARQQLGSRHAVGCWEPFGDAHRKGMSMLPSSSRA